MINSKYDEKNYRVLLDKRWSLENLNEFTRLYMQNYAFLFCLEHNVANLRASTLFKDLEDFKLRDGLTYVNIYSLFNRHIPQKEKPTIRAITYASPGFIELILNYEVAIKIAASIYTFLKGVSATAETYNKLHEIFINLDKRRKEKENSLLKLEADKVLYVQELNEKLATGLGFESLADMYIKIGNQEEVSRLLMAHYRRMKAMSKFVKDGKVKFPEK